MSDYRGVGLERMSDYRGVELRHFHCIVNVVSVHRWSYKEVY